MQLGYGIGIHEQDGQIGLGTHAHLVHHPQAQVENAFASMSQMVSLVTSTLIVRPPAIPCLGCA